MAKKAVTQVMEWLEAEVGEREGEEAVVVSAEKTRWAIKLLKRVDARDSQVQRRYRPKKSATTRR